MWHNKGKKYKLKINKTSTNVPLFMKLLIIILKSMIAVFNLYKSRTFWTITLSGAG